MANPPGMQAHHFVKKFLRKRWWLGATGVVGVITLVLAVAVACRPDNRPAPPSNQINGNCNGQGEQNRVNCQIVPTPRSLGQIKLEDVVDPTQGIVFDGPASALPTPPDYPPTDTMNHCPAWTEWIKTQPKMYVVNLTFQAGLTAGADDLAVIKAVNLKVLRRTPATTATLVKCTYGGGGNPGYWVTVDTLMQKTQFRSELDDTPRDMPPGSITLNGRDYQSVDIGITSQQKYLYDGILTVTAEVNGVEKILPMGTTETPERWTDAENSDWITSLGDGYDWDPTQKRWTPVPQGSPPSWAPTG